jgi:hypothetical protein
MDVKRPSIPTIEPRETYAPYLSIRSDVIYATEVRPDCRGFGPPAPPDQNVHEPRKSGLLAMAVGGPLTVPEPSSGAVP